MVGASPATDTMGAVTTRPRVLIVDDDLDTSRPLSVLLDGDGYACERASNGLEALDDLGRAAAGLEIPRASCGFLGSGTINTSGHVI